MTHSWASRPALACVGIALHEAPFNGDAEQRPLGKANHVASAAYHGSATGVVLPELALGASSQLSAFLRCAGAPPGPGLPRPLTSFMVWRYSFVMAFPPLAFRMNLTPSQPILVVVVDHLSSPIRSDPS